MNSKLIAGVVLAGVVIVGGIFAFASRSVPRQGIETSEQEATSEVATVPTTDQFPKEVLTQKSYVATIETADATQPNNTGSITLVYSSAKLWSVAADTTEGDVLTVYAGDASYIQTNDGTWIRYPLTNVDQTGIESYTFSDRNLEAFTAHAKLVGTEACSLGTCDIWEVTDNPSGSNGRVWLGPNNRLAKATLISGTTTTQINYDYEADTTVTIPKKFEEFTLPADGEFNLEALESLLSN